MDNPSLAKHKIREAEKVRKEQITVDQKSDLSPYFIPLLPRLIIRNTAEMVLK